MGTSKINMLYGMINSPSKYLLDRTEQYIIDQDVHLRSSNKGEGLKSGKALIVENAISLAAHLYNETARRIGEPVIGDVETFALLRRASGRKLDIEAVRL